MREDLDHALQPLKADPTSTARCSRDQACSLDASSIPTTPKPDHRAGPIEIAIAGIVPASGRWASDARRDDAS